ncbi:unnamed protein product [Rotaria magnacalcarata]|uniref:Uncharacterized protein n=1 Tax=Rotaria magnacalcarata TaxID=392030 RepID=A0A815GP07_9BILA|nr:unnamed protein product [Rotaria magnacalcarata]CAF4199516.1 unnamed protein product [Rotaria magnacalcarata]CAF4323961.1 unnamed protein product [Rotaria magnacalcarata]
MGHPICWEFSQSSGFGSLLTDTLDIFELSPTSSSNSTAGSLNYTSSTSTTQSQINTALIVGVGLAAMLFLVGVSGQIIFKTVQYCKKMPSTNKVQPEQVTPESNEPKLPNSKDQETPKKLHRPTVRITRTVDLRNAALAEAFLHNT